MSTNRMSTNRIPQEPRVQEPHAKRIRGYRHGLEQRSLRLPARQRHPLVGSFRFLVRLPGRGVAWVAVLFVLRIHRHASHGLSVYTRLCFLHQITVPIVSYPHIRNPIVSYTHIRAPIVS